MGKLGFTGTADRDLSGKRDSISARTDGNKHCRIVMERSVQRLWRIIS